MVPSRKGSMKENVKMEVRNQSVFFFKITATMEKEGDRKLSTPYKDFTLIEEGNP